MEYKTKNVQVNAMVFTLPSVEVGSILEYRLQLRYDDSMVSSPTWNVQQPYFVHKAHYFFFPSQGGGRYITNSRGDVARQADVRRESLRCFQDSTRRIRPLHIRCRGCSAHPHRRLDAASEHHQLARRVLLHDVFSGPQFWMDEGKRWAKDTDRFANPKALQQAAAEIVAPSDSEDQKARKIYAAVQKLDNTSFTREKSEAERKTEKLKEIKIAEDVWKQKSGSANDLALLYVALARAAGLKAYPMQVVNRDRAIFDINYLTTGQLDDYIAIVVLAGKEVYLDPGQKGCPYGLLHWKHTIAAGLRLADSGAAFGTTPADNISAGCCISRRGPDHRSGRQRDRERCVLS